eukprot:15473656-Alexandrium_andersonii.AAC.1
MHQPRASRTELADGVNGGAATGQLHARAATSWQGNQGACHVKLLAVRPAVSTALRPETHRLNEQPVPPPQA